MKKIKSIEITNSAFFKDTFKLDFSEHLNCLMGGRGTGKSTILHFIKACLESDAEEDRATFDVLKNNLKNGVITLEIESEGGLIYSIEKTFGEEAQPYLKATGQYCPLDNITNDLACDIFPAQIIEAIGKSRDERLKLIDKMLRGEIEEIRSKIDLQRIELEKNANDIRLVNLELKQTDERLREYTTAEEDLANLKLTPPEDIDEAERKEFFKQDAAEKVRGAEKRFLTKLIEMLTVSVQNTVTSSEHLSRTQIFTKNTQDFINHAITEPLVTKIEKALSSAFSANEATNKRLSELIVDINTTTETLKIAHAQQHNEFIQLKQKLDKHKVFYDRLNLLSKRLDEKSIFNKSLQELRERKERLKLSRINAIGELNKQKAQIHTLRLAKVNELNGLFEESRIKITLAKGGITDDYEDALRNALKGHNLRYNTLIPYIVESFTPDKLAAIIHNRDVKKLKEISGIDSERSQAVIDALYETDAIYDIETTYCPDLPDFHLKVDKAEDISLQTVDLYKKSDELSTGQRCTTVLPIVFAISDNPLIIDQPEDNLDNKYISETIRKIVRAQKGSRQLIFITHNPNIPVLSDADNNIFLTYEDMKTHVLVQGNVNEVKSEILNLLEGGKHAFQERDNLYKNEGI